MAELELSAGAVRYEDSGGEGPVIVLCHGLLMAASLWDGVVEALGPGVRCVRPTLPLGAHRRPMRAQADLSLRGQVGLLAEFLERLELEEVTLVFNDWCGAQLLVAQGWDTRVGRLVLASCETDDNYPPGRVAALAARLPGGLAAVLKPLRFKALRRLPMTFGLLSKRPIPDELFNQWLEPALTSPAIRRDLRKYAGDTRQGRRQLVKANSRLAGFGKPVLVAWAAEDKVLPAAAGRRLATSFPDSRFVEIPDSRTLLPVDQPRALADAIATFVTPTEPMRIHGPTTIRNPTSKWSPPRPMDRGRRLVLAVTLVAGLFMTAAGLAGLLAPSWFADAAGFPRPTHFVHDAGAFQLGIGVTLLLAVAWRDGPALALAGFLVANPTHAVNHAVDLDLGGHSSDPWGLAALSLLTAVALVMRLGQLGWVVGEVTTATIPALAPFARQKTVLVTSYRQDGRPVGTPVSLAVDGDHASLRSFEKAGKTRRIRHNPRVEVAPSTARGRPTGPAIQATARRLEGAQARRAARLLAAKHPLLHGVLVPLTHRLGRAKTGKTVQFQLTPLEPGQVQ